MQGGGISVVEIFVLIVAVVGVLWAAISVWQNARARKLGILRQAESRREILDELKAPDFKQAYERRLERGLGWLDRHFGEGRFAWRGLGLCFLIALVYALVFFMIGWGAGGPGTIGRTRLLDSLDPPWMQALWAAGLVLVWSLTGLVAFKSDAIDEAAVPWLSGRLPRFLARRAALIFRVGGGLAAGLIFYWALLGASGSFALAFALAFALTVVLAVRFSVAVTVAFAVAVAFALAAVFAGFFTGSGFGHEGTVTLILFVLLLPAANSVLDYVSLNISRALGWRIVEKRKGPVILRHSLYDLVAAALLLAARFSSWPGDARMNRRRTSTPVGCLNV